MSIPFPREQFRVSVPLEKRVPGWLYDADSGVLMGIASYELRATQPAGVVFWKDFCGAPHNTIIHPSELHAGGDLVVGSAMKRNGS